MNHAFSCCGWFCNATQCTSVGLSLKSCVLRPSHTHQEDSQFWNYTKKYTKYPKSLSFLVCGPCEATLGLTLSEANLPSGVPHHNSLCFLLTSLSSPIIEQFKIFVFIVPWWKMTKRIQGPLNVYFCGLNIFFHFWWLIKIGYIPPFLILPQRFILEIFKCTEVEIVISKYLSCLLNEDFWSNKKQKNKVASAVC